MLTPTFKDLILLTYVSLATSCSAISYESQIVLVGSTPGDEPIQSMLSISAPTQVDFIKWNLKLNDNKTFELTIIYGESQPNTLRFKDGGQTNSFRGSFVVNTSPETKNFREIYQLKSGSFTRTISLVKFNENLFHILNDDQQLMIGNGGWSYSLNRALPIHSGKVLISSLVTDKRTLRMVFDGRSPCQEIALEHPEMKVSQSCFKLKWRLTLNRDSITYAPTTCIIRKVVDNEPHDVTGNWTIIHGTTENPGVVIYRIETEPPGIPILLLAGDDDVLFFLDKKGIPFIGNENFSFTLNRRQTGSTTH